MRNIDPYRRRVGSADVAIIFVSVFIGILLGMVALPLVKRLDHRPVEFSMNGVDCRLCHMPVLKTYRTYRAYHKALRAVKTDDTLLAELVRP